MQKAPSQPMTRVQKLVWYAEQLITDAAAAEKSGNGETATSKYLQAAEILLLLAKAEDRYTVWKAHTDKAAMCQHRARGLIARQPTAGAPQQQGG